MLGNILVFILTAMAVAFFVYLELHSRRQPTRRPESELEARPEREPEGESSPPAIEPKKKQQR